MRHLNLFIPKMTLAVFICTLIFSCSKDTDLLSEYVIHNTTDITGTYGLLVNDTYYSDMTGNIVLDVLNNDNFENLNNVTVIGTSDPKFGSVVINEDNTITYTPHAKEDATEPNTAPPDTEEQVVDTFNYVAEEKSAEGEVITAEATVTVSNIENKAPTSGPNVFYVTTNGKSTNTGKTESSSWEITHAFKTAKAGDIVHIKAGNYGNKSLVVENSGTSNDPIRFIGYANTPGDVFSHEGSTFSYGEELDSSKMPLLKGTRINNEGKGEAIIITKPFIYISNFQIQHFEKGLRSSGDNNIIENLIVSEVGDFNPEHSKENAENAFVNYSGVGITLLGDNVVLKNSVVVNAGAEGIHVKRGTNQVHSFNSVFSDNEVNPCDYYYLFSTSSKNNTINHSFVYRQNGLSHKGHGLICKGDASENKFTNFEILNTVLELSFQEVFNNTFENGIIQGSFDRNVRFKNTSGGILIANGAHHNTLRNIKVINVEAIISFNDWHDGTNSVMDENDAGNNNIFLNIEGEQAEIAINFDEFAKLEGVAHNNLFKNSTFKNINRLFHVNRPNSKNTFEDCTFKNIESFEGTSNGYDYKLNTNTIFENCSWEQIDFTLP